ncbi:sporulation protein YlmC with PRC-barrel domain [Bacillus mesophilus]|uniref:DUF3221 domain-containing protein n=1 Tax=Bacillus mesophilus TaxID=1808955 RepID=A0A6M0Q6T4_9BACI|nr:hypothetical protein [Bacillus mesophilus]MBM7661371.1 sporulation protein YlmC with PRC-barrel domain [Bacillus mesophilus]NEY72044.1 hypothetical protein [Bacillus mesophilus]
MKILKFIPIVGLTLALTACGTTTAEESTETGVVTEGVSGSGENSSKEESKSIVIKEEASFVGQVDSNSIEVHTETETLTLQVGEVVNVDWSSLEKNALVTIEYFMNEEGQYELASIVVPTAENKESEKVEVITEKAAYVGQIDINSIEVNTEFETIALQVGEIKGIDWASIEKGEPITIEYYKNDAGQHILTNVTINR